MPAPAAGDGVRSGDTGISELGRSPTANLFNCQGKGHILSVPQGKVNNESNSTGRSCRLPSPGLYGIFPGSEGRGIPGLWSSELPPANELACGFRMALVSRSCEVAFGPFPTFRRNQRPPMGFTEMDAENLKTILDQSIDSYGTRTAVRVLKQGPGSQGPSYEPITYAELGRMRNAVASGLADLGVGKGDRVGILTDGGFEPLLVFLACDLLAVCTVPLCNKLPEEILTHNINHSGISFLVVDGKSLDQVDAVAASLEQPPKLILTEGSREDATPWDQVAGCEAAPPDVAVSPSDETKVIYTSGSSGLPKGVVQTHANIVANLRQVWDVVVESDNFRFFKSAPDYHSMGILNIYYPLAKGWELDLARSPDRVLTDIRVSEPEGFLTVPLVLDKVYGNVRKEIDAGGIKGRLVERAVGARQRIARGEGSLGDRIVSATIGGKIVAKIKEQLSKRVGSNLELLIVGSAKADPEALDFFQDVLGIRTLEGYGTTECAPLIATNHLKGRKTGTVGRPLFEVRLVDEQGEVLASADPASGTCRPGPGAGELWVSGANVMKEYLNDPERNAEVLVEKDGRRWYRTGDLFSMDEEGLSDLSGTRRTPVQARQRGVHQPGTARAGFFQGRPRGARSGVGRSDPQPAGCPGDGRSGGSWQDRGGFGRRRVNPQPP